MERFFTLEWTKKLVAPFCYGLLLNIDWFQPFDHFIYSVGVIYLVVLNLPRNVRYKRENVILIGIIPGPSEPPLTINSYLIPLVLGLLELWHGVQMEVSGSVPQLIRAALIAVSCDLPAGSKVCGFLSHSANLGLKRCYASFSEGFSRRNYANLDRSSWQLRTCNQHRADVKSLEQCKTKTEKSHRESQLGCRYSELLRLPYFDPVRMLLIDPMHCLFLGTANYITRKIWIGRQILNKDNLVLIEKRLQKVQVPLHIGRLPCNIDSRSTFTAEQWMIWTIYLSVYCLHRLLSTDEIEC